MFIARSSKTIKQSFFKRKLLNKEGIQAFVQSERPFSSVIDEEEDLIRRKRATRFLLVIFGMSAFAGFVYLGRPESSIEEKDKMQDHPYEGLVDYIGNYYRRAQKRLFSAIKNFTDPSAQQLLPPKSPDDNRPVLVVDLDDTLVHASWNRNQGWLIAKRPQADFFLAYLSQFYEIIVFSSKEAVYADPIIGRLDPYGVISYRLFRDSTKYVNGVHIKDISHLNRDPSKIVILDDDPREYALQPENAIPIKPWKGDDPKDMSLIELIPFLEVLAISNPKDIRQTLKVYRGTDIPRVFAENQRKFYETHDTDKKTKPSVGILKRLLNTKASIKTPFDFEQEQQRKYAEFIQNVHWRLQEWRKEVEQSQKSDNDSGKATV